MTKASRVCGSQFLCQTDISVYGLVYVELKTKQLLFLGIKFFLGDDAGIQQRL